MKKYFKYFLITIFIFLVNITTVSAESAEIVKVELDSKSENVVVNQEVLLDQNTIKSNVNFYDEGDYVIYKLTIKNNDDKEYFIEDIIDNNTNEYLNFEYIYEGLLEAKSEKEVLLKVTYISALPYDSVLTPTNSVTLNTAVSISVKLTDEIPVGDTDNPNTFDKAHIYLIIEVIGVSGLLVIFIKLKKKNMAMLLLLAVLLIPREAKAKIELKLEFSFSNDMEVKVNFLDKNYKTLITDSYTKIEFVKRASFTDNAVDVSEEKDESIMAWVENDTLYIGSKYKIFFPSDSGSLLSKSNLTEIKFNNRIDTTFVTNMDGMFDNDSNITELDVSSFRTGNVTRMNGMFRSTSSIEEIDLSNFDTSKLQYYNELLMNCTSLETLNMDGWDFTHTSFGGSALKNTTSLKELSAKNWITPRYATYLYSSIYLQDSPLETIDVTGWDLSNTESISGVFQNLKILNKIIGLDTWDTSNITNMSYAFYGTGHDSNKALDALDLSSWDISNATSIYSMFYEYGYNAKEVNINISGWKNTKVTNIDTMFSYIGKYSDKVNVTVNNVEIPNATSGTLLFYCIGANGKEVNLNINNLKVNKITDISQMFAAIGREAETVNININDINLSGGTNAHYFFESTGLYAKELDINLSNFTFNSLTSLSEAFYYTGNNAEKIDIILSDWNNPNVNNISYMFYHIGGNSGVKDIKVKFENFDTSSVTKADHMFYNSGSNADSYVIEGLGNVDLSNVSDLSYFFNGTDENGKYRDFGTLNSYATNITGIAAYSKGIRLVLNLHVNPTTYNYPFTNAATADGSEITVNYTSDVTNIDDIISNKTSGANVIKGSLIE